MAGKLFLVCQSHFCPWASCELSTGTFTLGRSSDCDFVVADQSVSRQHAELRVSASGVVVADLDSCNGTFVDGQRVHKSRVWPGQQLRFPRIVQELDRHRLTVTPSSGLKHATVSSAT